MLIPVHSGKYPNLFALVDEADFELVSQYRWNPSKGSHTFYAEANKGYPDRYWQMHRLILGLKKGDLDVDHIDGNGLNNTRANLRLCTDTLNRANQIHPVRPGVIFSSRFRGVSWNKSSGKWQAAVKARYRSYHLGCFDDEIEAAKAYDTAARKHFGPYARPNFPETN